MTKLTALAIIARVLAAVPSDSLAFYTVTDGLEPAELKQDNVKIAVVKKAAQAGRRCVEE